MGLTPLLLRFGRFRAPRGHAVAEFVAMLAVLVPLLLLTPILGKYADLSHTTVQASRYGAWERTIASEDAKSDAQLNVEVRRRFYSRPEAFIKTNEGVAEAAAYRNPLWVDHSGRRLLQNFGRVNERTQNDSTPGTAAGLVSGLTGGFLAAVSAFGSDGDFDLDERGLYRANVEVGVATLPASSMARGQDCAGAQSNDVYTCIRRHNVILADAWTSRSPQEAARRVRALVPMGALDEVTGVLGGLSGLPFLEELGRFEPGRVSPDVIPSDRLGPPRP